MTASYRLAWLLFHVLFRVYFRWRVHHPERLPPQGPAIIAANHASFLDPLLVGTSARRLVSMLARDSLFRYFGVRQLLLSWRAVPVDREGRGVAGLREIMNRLQHGGAVLLFPEGTRTRDGQFQSARPGVGLIVLRAGVPVVPLRLFGTYQALNRAQRFPRPYPITVKYGQPLDFSKARREMAHCSKERQKALYQEVADTIMKAIVQLQPWEEKTTFP